MDNIAAAVGSNPRAVQLEALFIRMPFFHLFKPATFLPLQTKPQEPPRPRIEVIVNEDFWPWADPDSSDFLNPRPAPAVPPPTSVFLGDHRVSQKKSSVGGLSNPFELFLNTTKDHLRGLSRLQPFYNGIRDFLLFMKTKIQGYGHWVTESMRKESKEMNEEETKARGKRYYEDQKQNITGGIRIGRRNAFSE